MLPRNNSLNDSFRYVIEIRDKGFLFFLHLILIPLWDNEWIFL